MSLYTFNNQTGSIPLSELDDNFSSVYAYVLSAGTANTANIANVAYSVSGANVTGNVTNAVYVTGNAQANVTSVGTLTSLSVSGNILTNSIILAGGNILTGSNISATGNVTGGNILTGNNISATGNIFGNFYNGNGSLLTGVIATGVGTLTNLSVTGNITSGNVSTGVITLINGATIKDTVGNAVVFGQGADAGINAVAVGNNAGNYLQSANAVAVGDRSGSYTQGAGAVAVGQFAGNYLQGAGAVAVGNSAGYNGQGINAVAIGYLAGNNNQANNSIIINATGATLDQTTANTFTVSPVRNDVANTGQILFYNTTSKEITYGNTISVTGNVTFGNVSVTNGLSLNSALQFANLTTTQINAITPTTYGMTVYNYTTGNIQVYNGVKWANITLS